MSRSNQDNAPRARRAARAQAAALLSARGRARGLEAAMSAGAGMAGAHCIHEMWMRAELAVNFDAALERLWQSAAASIPDWLPMRHFDWLPLAYEVAARFRAQRRGRSNLYLVLLDYRDSRRSPSESTSGQRATGRRTGSTSTRPGSVLPAAYCAAAWNCSPDRPRTCRASRARRALDIEERLARAGSGGAVRAGRSLGPGVTATRRGELRDNAARHTPQPAGRAASTPAAPYAGLLRSLTGLLAGESDLIANMANFSALVYTTLPELNWAGFYLLRGEELVLGPFQGRPACVRIAMGRGVCGSAALRRASVLVPDVHEFPGHIACDEASRSELVVPLVEAGRLIGVLDLDSPVPGRFTADDQAAMEAAVRVLMDACRAG